MTHASTNSLWIFLIISETHHVPSDFEIYVEWYLNTQLTWSFDLGELIMKLTSLETVSRQ